MRTSLRRSCVAARWTPSWRPPRSSGRWRRPLWVRCRVATATPRRSSPTFNRSCCPPSGSPLVSLETVRGTHEVLNQSVPFEDVDLFGLDPALQEALDREGAAWAADRVREAGLVAASAVALEHGRRAERNEPRLITHDRYGHRVDRVELDPSWHWLLDGAISRGIHALPWAEPRDGAHVARAALEMLWTHANAGVMCPVSMTYSAVPALRRGAGLAAGGGARLAPPPHERGGRGGGGVNEEEGGPRRGADRPPAAPGGA